MFLVHRAARPAIVLQIYEIVYASGQESWIISKGSHRKTERTAQDGMWHSTFAFPLALILITKHTSRHSVGVRIQNAIGAFTAGDSQEIPRSMFAYLKVTVLSLN